LDDFYAKKTRSYTNEGIAKVKRHIRRELEEIKTVGKFRRKELDIILEAFDDVVDVAKKDKIDSLFLQLEELFERDDAAESEDMYTRDIYIDTGKHHIEALNRAHNVSVEGSRRHVRNLSDSGN